MARPTTLNVAGIIEVLKRKISSLQQQWRSTRRENERLRKENEALRQERERLRRELDKLKRQLEMSQVVGCELLLVASTILFKRHRHDSGIVDEEVEF